MNLKFGKDNIEIDGVVCDLSNLDNQKLFSILEKVVDNEENIVFEKTADITPLSEKFYEIFEKQLIKEDFK